MENVTFLLQNMDVGGVQRVNNVIAKSLSKDYEVNILLTQYKNIEFTTSVTCHVIKRYTRLEDYSLRAIKKIPINLNLLKKSLNKKLAEKIVYNLKKINTDIVIVNAELILLVPMIKRMAPNITIISWVHNNIDIYLNRYFKKEQEDLKIGLRVSDKNICLTKYDLEKIKNINRNTFCIANPLTLENTEISDLDNPYIICVARYSVQHKGLDYLIEIASKLPDPWTIKLVGSGNRKEQKEISKLIERWRANDKIELCGNLRGSELNDCYRKSSLYLMTSRWEGFPLVLAEAMSFGLPIVAFNQTGANEVLQEGKFGVIVEQGNTGAMLNSLLEIINNEQKMEELSSLSIKRTDDFRISTISEQWKLLINNK